MAAVDLDVGIRKQIIYGGRGDLPTFGTDTKMTFHFRTICPDETGRNEETVMDDSRTMGCGPFELICGRKFKMAVWEKIVQTMKIGEVARFTCQKHLVTDYPLVSKSLRYVAKKTRGEVVDLPSTSHCCGAGLHGPRSTGYEDLDHLQHHPVDIVFEIELLSVDSEGSYEKEIWSMTEDEMRTAIHRLKEKGNELYRDKQYEKAAETYGKAIGCAENLESKEHPGSSAAKAMYDMKEPLLLNYTQCKLNLGEYVDVIAHTTTVLKHNPNNVKALFRRGKAYALSWKPKEARTDLNRVLELDSSLKKMVSKILQDLDTEQKKRDAEDRKRLQGKGMFK
jgi:AH receptor-interacting protein